MTGEILKAKIRKCTERKEGEMGINTSFVRDVPAAILVKGNIPSRFDIKLHAYVFFSSSNSSNQYDSLSSETKPCIDCPITNLQSLIEKFKNWKSEILQIKIAASWSLIFDRGGRAKGLLFL